MNQFYEFFWFTSIFRTLSNTRDVAFYENSRRALAVSYYYKTLYLWCLSGFWIRLRKSFFDKRNTYTKKEKLILSEETNFQKRLPQLTHLWKESKLQRIWASKCKLTSKHLFWVVKSNKGRYKRSWLFAYPCFL